MCAALIDGTGHTAGVRTVRRLLGAVVLVVVLAGCRVEATVEVEVAADGSGRVALEAVFDPAAVEALDGLAEGVLLTDLAAAGWDVTRPELAVDGSITISANRAVASGAGLQRALDDIAGAGVFTDVRLTSTDRFAGRTQSLSFDIDLSEGWNLFSDAEVAAALDGEPFGVPVAQLTDGRSIDDVLGVSVIATLSGDEEQAPLSGDYSPGFDDTAVTQVRLEATVENSTAVLLRTISIALAFLAALSLALAIVGLFLQRRSEQFRPASMPRTLSSRIPGRATGPAPAATLPPATRNDDAVHLVVIEPLSVLYHQSEPPEHYLLPFVRGNGGEARADVLLDVFDDVVRGRVEPARLWEAAGLDGDSGEIDDLFVSMRSLRKDAPSFLRQLERLRIPVAALSNDAASWSSAVRQRDRLTSVRPWLVSAELGAVKPDPGIFERLRRETGVAYGHCLYIDTRIEHLDAARELGMRTALYDADGLDLPELVGHPVVRDLLGFVRRSI